MKERELRRCLTTFCDQTLQAVSSLYRSTRSREILNASILFNHKGCWHGIADRPKNRHLSSHAVPLWMQCYCSADRRVSIIPVCRADARALHHFGRRRAGEPTNDTWQFIPVWFQYNELEDHCSPALLLWSWQRCPAGGQPVMVSNGVLILPLLRLDKVTSCSIDSPKITKTLMGG